MQKARGFSLIEIAVVVFIAGLLLAAAAAAFNAYLVGTRERATRTKLEAIKTSLTSFLVRNNRLPCPAIITIPTGGANNGVEAATPGTCTGVSSSGVAPNIVKTGAIPWASLGLPEEATLDGYGNRFTYQVTAVATNLTAATVAGMLGSISIHSAGLGVPGNQTNNCIPVGGTYNPCGAVVVIVSHGANGHGAYNSTGQQIPIPATVTGNDERENTNNDNQFVVKGYSDVVTNPYDDIVLFITAGDLITPLAAQGTLKDYQAAITAKMAVIKGAVIANAYANGSLVAGQRQYSFPVALPIIPAAQLNDPWGTAIVYNRNVATVQCSTTPLTDTVFTLTSRGQDTVASVDDITTTITVADIVSIISVAGCNL